MHNYTALFSTTNTMISVPLFTLRRANSTYVKRILLTLSKVDTVGVTREDAVTLLTNFISTQRVKLVAVNELHKDGGLHLHILILLGEGISKNTYREQLRLLFNMFTGRGIDIQGVKNLTNTVRYILKTCSSKEDTLLVNTSWIEVLSIAKIEELLLQESIQGFTRFEEWKNRSVIFKTQYLKTPKKVILIWTDLQETKVKTLKTYLPVLDKASYLGLDINKRGRGLGFDAILFLFKLCRVLFWTHGWKQTNILLRGGPNTGKTSFFKKFEESGMLSLYWASARPGDFTMFRGKSPLILLDDVITKGNKWPLALLLKLLGSEGFTGDVKMGNITVVPAKVPVVVITNFPNLFIFSEPIRARLADCHLHNPVDWRDISNQEFISLISLFRDLVPTYPNLFNALQYGTEVSLWIRETTKGDLISIWIHVNKRVPFLTSTINLQEGEAETSYPVSLLGVNVLTSHILKTGGATTNDLHGLTDIALDRAIRQAITPLLESWLRMESVRISNLKHDFNTYLDNQRNL